MTEAVKHDNEKPRMELLPHLPLVEIAKVLTLGAKKYSADNWRNGFEWRRLIGALERHVGAWKDGEDLDPETGLSHLAHAGCEVLFLLEHEIRGLGYDDRWKPIPSFQNAEPVRVPELSPLYDDGDRWIPCDDDEFLDKDGN